MILLSFFALRDFFTHLFILRRLLLLFVFAMSFNFSFDILDCIIICAVLV
jgi:hypothetical protein